ncbi:hypothetical protein [Mesorhizobium sp. Root157]|uniref:hypothetical protein n=1 Tax=Mesorhizobium sp. Root157 TaxID=1736477 RepID=UPI0012E3F04D|nr:hypothetical protein [Mesorhizobium sp. Root157]
MLNNITTMTTRRTILTAIGLSPLATLPAVAAVSPEERIERAMKELQDALVAMHGGQWWSIVDHDCGLTSVSRSSSKTPYHTRTRGGVTRAWDGAL